MLVGENQGEQPLGLREGSRDIFQNVLDLAGVGSPYPGPRIVVASLKKWLHLGQMSEFPGVLLERAQGVPQELPRITFFGHLALTRAG